MLRHRVLALLAILVTVAIVAPWRVSACTCVILAPREAFARSAAVFAGTVVGIEPAPGSSAADTAHAMRVKFLVWRRWKGPVGVTVVVATAAETPSCGYPFRHGGTYLVYALGPEDDLSANLCSRTRPVFTAAEDLIALGEANVPVALLAAGAFVLAAVAAVRRSSRLCRTDSTGR